ncbi:MAG: hypothetical protein ORN49_06290, partial [Rhodobacteraceae bacterium]|nr:hypothetical protein [Paracoccaceae bacterium]
TVTQAARIEDCLSGIAAGDYDVVSIEAQVAVPKIKELAIEADVVELPDLTTIQPIAAIGYKANPFTRENLTLLNRGLNEMRDNGLWYEIAAASRGQ